MACHGGQQAAAELLLGNGADLNWIGYDHLMVRRGSSLGR
jgi:hypothetical protein